MSNTLKKTMASLLIIAFLSAGTTFLSGCNDKADSSDQSGAGSTEASVVLTQEIGAAGTAAQAAPPTALPSMAPGEITFAGQTVPPAEYDFYYYTIYSNFSQYASYGAVPVDEEGKFDLTAICSLSENEEKTWGEYIKDTAKKELQDSYILAGYAEKSGIKLSDTDMLIIDSFYTSVQSYADSFSMPLEEYLATMYGDKISKSVLDLVVERYLLAGVYLEQLKEDYTFTDAELEGFYTKNKDSYENIDLPIVRHILFAASTGMEGTTDATQEELNKAKGLAEAAIAGAKTYDDMVSIGDAAFADGSAKEAAEYTVRKGEMVEAFEEWCYDTARKPGDTGIVKTEFGYHAMYFVSTEKDWMKDALAFLTTEKYDTYILEQENLPQFALTIS